MMPIKQKLKSENGASFLLALLAFLVAAMVCVTIITAATSSVKRVHSDRESQQMQLAITSAAQLVRDEMLAAQYTVTEVAITENGTTTAETTKTMTGVFAAELQAAITHIDTYATTAVADGMGLSVPNLPNVAVSFEMSATEAERYKLLFTLQAQDTGEVLYLMMEPNLSDPIIVTDNKNNEKTVITTKTTTLKWDNPTISGIKGAL